MISNSITGIVLAGGKSSRMGINKSLMPYKGKPLVMHAVDVLRKVCDTVVISARDNHYQFTGCEVWKDELSVNAPINGIYTCLKRSATELNVVLSCDMPLVDPRIILELLQVSHDSPIVMPVHDGNYEPLCAVYNKKVLVCLETFLAANHYGLTALAKEAGGTFVEIHDPMDLYHPGMFMNINTSADFDLLNNS